MKKCLFFVFAITFLTGISCKEKIDIEKEKEAVLKVLQEEGDAFAVSDMKRISAVHLQDKTDTRLEQGPDSYDIYNGWDEINRLYEGFIESTLADSSYKNLENIKENIIIKVVGNAAWLICDNKWKYYNNDIPGEDTNIQIAFFEKINGEWKFSFNAFVQKPVPKTEPL
jgi:hypothetical protein